MKTKFLYIGISFLLFSFSVYAKEQSGIYASLEDYKNNKLTYSSDCGDGKKIRLHNFFGTTPFITVVSGGKKYKFRKSTLYGFRNCNDKVYRLYKNDAYYIAESGNIYIYTQTENITQTKGFKVINVYYFSRGADGEIMRLNMNNLKSAFKDNIKFLELLDEFFQVGPMSAYDDLHKMYKVNYIFSKAVQ